MLAKAGEMRSSGEVAVTVRTAPILLEGTTYVRPEASCFWSGMVFLGEGF